jgi:hypothetical protein
MRHQYPLDVLSRKKKKRIRHACEMANKCASYDLAPAVFADKGHAQRNWSMQSSTASGGELCESSMINIIFLADLGFGGLALVPPGRVWAEAKPPNNSKQKEWKTLQVPACWL